MLTSTFVSDFAAISVAIEADRRTFQVYDGGIYDAACGTELDHGALVVGYDLTVGDGYWIVKNSWGRDWGEHGFIWMRMGIVECAVLPVDFSQSGSSPVIVTGLNRPVSRAGNCSGGPQRRTDDVMRRQSAVGTRKGRSSAQWTLKRCYRIQ